MHHLELTNRSTVLIWGRHTKRCTCAYKGTCTDDMHIADMYFCYCDSKEDTQLDDEKSSYSYFSQVTCPQNCDFMINVSIHVFQH